MERSFRSRSSAPSSSMPHLDPQSVIDYTIVVIAKLTGSIDYFSFFAANRRNSMASPPHL